MYIWGPFQISFLSYVFVDQIKFEGEREGCVVCVVSYVIAFVGEVPFPQTRGTRRVSKGVKGEGFRYVCKCVCVGRSWSTDCKWLWSSWI